jgi:hypothetical protein
VSVQTTRRRAKPGSGRSAGSLVAMLTARPTSRLGLRRLSWLAAAWAIAMCVGCANTPEVDPQYRPAENVLEIIAVLRAHISDDTYRFEPARDFTGRNVYRSSLLRLENLERLHADALRVGHMDGVISFAKARSFERLSAFDLASQSYRLAADQSEELRAEAFYSADVCDTLQRAALMNPGLESTGDDEADQIAEQLLLELDSPAVLEEFETRLAILNELALSVVGTHYEGIVAEEVERTDLLRANYFEGIRTTRIDGDVLVLSERQRVISRHSESKNFNRHLLSLADLYAELAVGYAEAHPPESLSFDPVRFQELIEGASRLYEMVARRDGTPEKIEASRRLEAFLAFAIRIDRDRFTP